MKLFIPDLYEVLKCRVKKLTSPKESSDPVEVLLRLEDVKTICNELESVAKEQVIELEKIRNSVDTFANEITKE